jgi:hypothetical protein
MTDDPTRDDVLRDDLPRDDLMDGPMNDHVDDLDAQALDRELDDRDDLLSSQLRELLDPAAGFSERTTQDIDRSLRGRSGLTAALDLLGLGWWTARALLGYDGADDATRHTRTLSSDPRRADPEGEGT